MSKAQFQELYNFLCRVTHWQEGKPDLHDIKEAVKAELAQPQAEPVLWVPPERDGEFHHDHSSVTGYRNRMAGWMPLYAAPQQAQPQAEPVCSPTLTECPKCKNDWKQCPMLHANRATPQQAQPAPAPDDALNALAKLFHNGEEIESDDGAAMVVDLSLWHEASDAFNSLIGDGDGETLASSAAPAVQPLSHFQIINLARDAQIAFCLEKEPSYDIALARAIEQAHGIAAPGSAACSG